MWLIILMKVLAVLIYFKLIRPLRYWKRKGVPYVKPLPIVGNLGANVIGRRCLAYIMQDNYNIYPNSRYTGLFAYSSPSLMLRDPDLIKQIAVKEFETFPERKPFLPDNVDTLWSKNLFAIKGGEDWHRVRTILSPSFTGSKMRTMFVLMKSCSEQFSKYFSKGDGEVVAVELKDAFTRFANDVIATTAFGITCNSLEEPNNEFYIMGKTITDFSGLKNFKFIFFLTFPGLTKLFKLQIFSKTVKTFFRNLVKNTIKVREEQNVFRPDMIHLLMEARKETVKCEKNEEVVDTEFAIVEEHKHWRNRSNGRQKMEITDEDITAQVLVFFFAGFDTVSTMMCYAAYELALNVDIQERLRREVDETLKKFNGNTTYEAIVNMSYLDMVVSETLRKWPPFIMIDRISVSPFTIKAETSNEKDVHLDTGTVCTVPIFSIHRDPKYYPEPEKFDPERFNKANKNKIRPFTYLPFGTGPRNCIGSRFALLEGKLVLAEIVSKFEIVPVEKTEIPIALGKRNFNPVPDNGFWLGLRRRDSVK